MWLYSINKGCIYCIHRNFRMSKIQHLNLNFEYQYINLAIFKNHILKHIINNLNIWLVVHINLSELNSLDNKAKIRPCLKISTYMVYTGIYKIK